MTNQYQAVIAAIQELEEKHALLRREHLDLQQMFATQADLISEQNAKLAACRRLSAAPPKKDDVAEMILTLRSITRDGHLPEEFTADEAQPFLRWSRSHITTLLSKAMQAGLVQYAGARQRRRLYRLAPPAAVKVQVPAESYAP